MAYANEVFDIICGSYIDGTPRCDQMRGIEKDPKLQLTKSPINPLVELLSSAS